MNKDEVMTIRMRSDVKKKLKELARIENRSMGNLIETMIMEKYDGTTNRRNHSRNARNNRK